MRPTKPRRLIKVPRSMLAQFRTLAKSPAVIALLGLLTAAFVLWGVRDVFRNVGMGDAVIQAGSRSINAARFRQMFEDELKSYTQQTGQQITPQDAVKNGLDRQVADALAADEAFAAYLSRTGLNPSDKLVVDEIRKAPRFFNPVSGVFDKGAYEQFVHQQLNMTDAEFEGLLRTELAQSQFVSALGSALKEPRMFDALSAAAQYEGRSFTYLVLPITAVPAPALPTEAAMQAYLKENAERLKQQRQETRILTIVRFSAAQDATSPVSAADVQKRFDFEKDALSSPEKRSVIELAVKDAATATAISARLKHGEDPAGVAKSLGIQPITYTDAPKSAIADRKAADVAFSLKAGDISGAIQGDLGYAVIKVSQITPAHTATLEETRPKIEAEVRKAAAQTKVDQQVKAFEDARSAGANLVEAAKKLGLQTQTLPAITAQGATAQGQPLQLPPKLLQSAFTLQPGADSDVIDLGSGDFVAARLDKIIPPAAPTLDEIRPQLTQFLMRQDLDTRLMAKAQGLADQIKKGQSLDAVGTGAGATVGNGVDIQRSSAGQSFTPQLMAEVFNAKVGEVVVGPDIHPGQVIVAKVAAIIPAAGPAAAQAAANQRLTLPRGLLQDIGAETRAGAKALIKPKVDYARAKAAVGGDAGAAP
jgi:peptidyl-prolyl cis-trans isomerase D